MTLLVRGSSDVKMSKATIKKIIGYISSIVVLVFLGEPFLSDVGTFVQITSEAQ